MREAFADGAAFVPYLAAGDTGRERDPPDIETAKATTAAFVDALVAGGADVVELGVPFSEPIADGPTIQEATVRALEAGMTAGHCFDLVRSLSVDVPVVLMTYFNVIYRYGDTPGVEAFVRDAADAGVAGVIVPDLPVEESRPVRSACDTHDVDLIFVAAPTTRDDRLAEIMEVGSGFLYVQARLGTTGSRADVSDQTRETLDRIRQFEARRGGDALPKGVGFGVSSGDQAAEIIEAGADGVIVGSALVDLVASADDPAEATERLERKATELKEGALAGSERRRSDAPRGDPR